MTINARWLPSKQFGMVLASVILVGVLVAAAYLYTPSPEKSGGIEGITPSQAISRESISSTDSDGDGLKDWEEVLWQTDPNNPDSDGDGTPDGEEVLQNRDPALAGPEDAILPDNALGSTAVDISEVSQSQVVLGTLVSRYMTLAGTGGSLQPNQANELVNTLLNQKPSLPEAQQYTISDLRVTPDNSEPVVRTYGNLVGSIFANRPGAVNELAVFALFGESGDFEELESLENVANSYEEIVRSLASVAVPSSFVSTHVALMNTLSTLATQLRSMAEHAQDPLALLIILGEYQTSSDGFISLFQALRNQLRQTGVVFSPEEGGFIITSEQKLGV